MDSMPAKRLAEVMDIAETIINSLLPDDRDDEMGLWDERQVESDVEAFENLTC
jgi:hypothetical protein